MKKIIFTLQIIFLLTFNVKADKTIIVGKILNYQSINKDVYPIDRLQVSYYNIIWQEKYESTIIENDGSFKFSFDLPFSQDIYIKSGTGDYIAYLLAPSGEKIELNLKYELLNQKNQEQPSSFYIPDFECKFLGKSKLKQDKFHDFYYGWILKERVADQIFESDSIEKQMKSLKKKLRTYFEENPKQKDLYNWGYSHLFYLILMNYLDYGENIDLKKLDFPSFENVICRIFFGGLYEIGNFANINFYKKHENTIKLKIKEAVLLDNTLQLSKKEKELIKSTSPELKLSEEDSLVMAKITKKISNSDYLTEFQDSLFFHYNAKNLNNKLPRNIADIIIARQIIDNSYPRKRCEYINEKLIKDFTISIINEK